MTGRIYRYAVTVVAIIAVILGVIVACAPQESGDGVDEELMAMGETVFEQNCASCHGTDGQGTPGVPALAGNATVTGDPEGVIQTVFEGPSTMPAFRDELSDEEIAAVISYIRNTWGNEAPTISADDVAAAR